MISLVMRSLSLPFEGVRNQCEMQLIRWLATRLPKLNNSTLVEVAIYVISKKKMADER